MCLLDDSYARPRRDQNTVDQKSHDQDLNTLSIYLFIYLFIYSFINSFIYSCIYVFICFKEKWQSAFALFKTNPR